MAGRVLQPLEDSYEAQRQFVANASHELRAPLTRQRALIEVALAGPEANFASLRSSPRARARIRAAPRAADRRAAGAHARPSRARAPRAPRPRGARLPGHARPRVGARRPRPRRSRDARHGADRGRSTTARAPDRQPDRQRDPPQHPRRAHRDRHRDPRPARLRVDREHRPGRSRPRRSSVSSNPSNDLAAPAPGTTAATDSGLSIVQAIANAHGAELSARARPEGGLTIEVSFPAAIGGRRPLRFATVRSSVPRRSGPRRPW